MSTNYVKVVDLIDRFVDCFCLIDCCLMPSQCLVIIMVNKSGSDNTPEKLVKVTISPPLIILSIEHYY